MISGSHAEPTICCMVMVITSSGMDNNQNTKTSRYGVLETTLSMGMLQERILMIDHIEVISWDMQLL